MQEAIDSTLVIKIKCRKPTSVTKNIEYDPHIH